MGRTSVLSSFSAGESGLFRLSRSSLNQGIEFTSAQTMVDGGVTHFLEESARFSTFASIVAGGGASRLAKTGILALGSKATGWTARAVQGLAAVGSLGAEAVAFESTGRAIQTVGTSGGSSLPPNLWRWKGEGGLKQGFSLSAITFGAFRGAGRAAQGQNIVFQHAAQSTAMVAGHNLGGILNVISMPDEPLSEQFFHAERMNIELGAGMAFFHSMAPGLHGLERSLDQANSQRTKILSSRKGGTSFFPELAPELVGNKGSAPLEVDSKAEAQKNQAWMQGDGGDKSISPSGPSGVTERDHLSLLEWLNISGRASEVARGRPAWQSHLQANQKQILKAASLVVHSGKGLEDPQKRPVAMVLGAGACRDVPLRELAREFRVILVDLDVGTMKQALEDLPPELRPYVSFQFRDVTGDKVFEFARKWKAILEDRSLPSFTRRLRFITEALRELTQTIETPALAGEGPVDFMVSTMLVSQMIEFPLASVVYRLSSESRGQDPSQYSHWFSKYLDEVRIFGGRAVTAHIQALNRFVKEKGGVAFISSDVRNFQREPRNPTLIHEQPTLFHPDGKGAEHLEEYFSAEKDVRISEKGGWVWDFVRMGENPEHVPLLKLMPPEYRSLLVTWKRVEALTLERETTPAERLKTLRNQLLPTLRLTPENGEGFIPRILAIQEESLTFERYEALLALGTHKDFQNYGALIESLRRLSQQGHPVDLEPVIKEVEAVRGNADLDSREAGALPPEHMRFYDQESPLLEIFAFRSILEQVSRMSSGEPVVWSQKAEAGPEQANAILLAMSLASLASHPNFKGAENFRSVIEILLGSKADPDTKGFALLEVVKNKNLEDDRSFRLVLEALPQTFKEGQPTYWTHQMIDRILNHPHFDAANHLENFVQAVDAAVKAPNFRVIFYADLAKHPRFQGKEEFRILLSFIVGSGASPELILKAVGDVASNVHFEDVSTVVQIIELSPARPEAKLDALSQLLKNLHVDEKGVKAILEKIGKAGAPPVKKAEALRDLMANRSIYDPEILQSVVEGVLAPFGTNDAPRPFLKIYKKYLLLMTDALGRVSRNPIFSRAQMTRLVDRIEEIEELGADDKMLLIGALEGGFERTHQYAN